MRPQKRTVESHDRDGFEAMFRLSPVGILISSQLGGIVDANDAALSILRLSRAELLGRTSVELGLVPPQVRERALRCVRAHGSVRDLEVTLALPSGDTRDVNVAIQLIGMHGEPRYVTFFTDITRRRRAEKSFRALLESAPDATVIVDEQGRIVLANTQVERVFGYDRVELVGEFVERLIPERYRREHVRHRAAFFASPSAHPMGAQHDLYGLKKNGAEFPAEITLSLLETEDGPHAMAAVRDVTERKALQLRLALSDRLASVGTLAAGVAHEINNPLAFILANLDLLAEELHEIGSACSPESGAAHGGGSARSPESGAAHGGGSTGERVPGMLELVSEAREGAERVRKIVRGMKVFTHADDDRREPIELARVLDVASSMAANEIRHRARLVKDYQPTRAVLADESRLVQVFINLLVNAAQALPEGQAASHEIRLVLRTDGCRAVVEVRDTGRGIPPEIRARIFDPFFTTKPAGVGVGLGLTICHGIVVELGGEITVDSEPNVGTTFRVVLPTVRAEATSEHARAAPAPNRPPRKGRVLVVDDDAALGSALRRVLRDQEVTVAASGRAALDLLLSGASFDVILCDVMMPEMTGAELHAKLTEKRPGVCGRMVFMTAGPFTPSARDFLDRVPNRRLEKPCDTQELRAIVHGMLR
jgi:PAS domain S-box-containing protein